MEQSKKLKFFRQGVLGLQAVEFCPFVMLSQDLSKHQYALCEDYIICTYIPLCGRNGIDAGCMYGKPLITLL